jgi:hypothetical protein
MLPVSKAGSTWYAILSASATRASPRGVPGAAFARADACAGAGPRFQGAGRCRWLQRSTKRDLCDCRHIPMLWQTQWHSLAPFMGGPCASAGIPVRRTDPLQQFVFIATWGRRSPSSTRTSSVCTSSSARFLFNMCARYQIMVPDLLMLSAQITCCSSVSTRQRPS